MNEAAKKAIQDRLSYLEDNRYRYVNLGGFPTTHPVVLEHDKEIRELKEALADAKV